MPTIYNPNKRKGLFFIPSGAIKSESAAFSSTNSFKFDGFDEKMTTTSGIMGNVDLSTSYWLNTTAVGTWRPMWGFCIQATGSTNNSFGRLYFYSNIGLRAAAGNNFGSTNLNDGNWHHIVETYTASTKVKNIYVDGNTTPEATVTLPIWWNPPTYGFAAITIGSYYPPNTSYLYEGYLDECSVFDKVLSSEEIISIYNNNIPGDLSSFNPIAWYRMGETATYSNPGGSGNWTLVNQGSGSYNATSVNMEEDDKTSEVPV